MIAVIDYGMGNVTSVRNSFTHLGFETVLTSDISVLEKCSALVLPGVGAFGAAVDELNRKGLLGYLVQRKEKGTLILGICLGLQLFFQESQESPGHTGLGFLPGKVRRFSGNAKVPHIGWNRVYLLKNDSLFHGITDGSHFYFAHSYYAVLEEREDILATCSYGDNRFPAAVRKNNLYGLQFHPEKSGDLGLRILRNFGRMVANADYSRC